MTADTFEFTVASLKSKSLLCVYLDAKIYVRLLCVKIVAFMEHFVIHFLKWNHQSIIILSIICCHSITRLRNTAVLLVRRDFPSPFNVLTQSSESLGDMVLSHRFHQNDWGSNQGEVFGFNPYIEPKNISRCFEQH